MQARDVPGFLPSTHGLRFANRWPSTPALWLGRGYVRVAIGDAADGLCGGMAFVVRDRWEAGVDAPGDMAPPAAGTPLFAEIVRRQVDSFDALVRLPARFWAWAALRPERPNRWSRVSGLGTRGAATVLREWPQIRAAIHRGELPQLGLVRGAGISPLALGRHHQVLGYGYRVDAAAGALAIRVYDPNWPGRDDVELTITLGRDSAGRQAVAMAQSTGEPLLGVFLAPYIPPRGDETGRR